MSETELRVLCSPFSSSWVFSLALSPPTSTESQTHRSSDSFSSWFMRYPLSFLVIIVIISYFSFFFVSPIYTMAMRSLSEFPRHRFTQPAISVLFFLSQWINYFSFFFVSRFSQIQKLIIDLVFRNLTLITFSSFRLP